MKICRYINILKYNLVNLHSGIYLHVFRDDDLILDNQLVCSTLEEKNYFYSQDSIDDCSSLRKVET